MCVRLGEGLAVGCCSFCVECWIRSVVEQLSDCIAPMPLFAAFGFFLFLSCL